MGFQGTLVLKWVLVLMLALLTAISIAAVHRTGERTAAIAQVLFCLAAWMSFSMVASHIQPYRGPDALTAAPLQALRASLSRKRVSRTPVPTARSRSRGPAWRPCPRQR